MLEYKGTLSVSRAHVSIYFQNLGAQGPTPPGPLSPICKYIYLGFTGVFFFIDHGIHERKNLKKEEI